MLFVILSCVPPKFSDVTRCLVPVCVVRITCLCLGKCFANQSSHPYGGMDYLIWYFYHNDATEYTMNPWRRYFKVKTDIAASDRYALPKRQHKTTLVPFCLKQGAEWLPTLSQLTARSDWKFAMTRSFLAFASARPSLVVASSRS